MQEKVVIVTGGTQGIGQGIVEAFAKNGANVVLTSRKLKSAQDAADNYSGCNGKVLGCEFDIEKREGIASLIDFTLKNFGKIDVLVNNALSQSIVYPLETMSDDKIEFAITSNITNTFILTKEIFPHLRATKGNVINISSAITSRYVENLQLYAIMKAALEQMTKVLASEWATDNVRVNAIKPGFIYTSALKYFDIPEDVIDNNYEHFKQFHPLGCIGHPEDVGKLALYLASDAADFVTGSHFDVDGGYSIQSVPSYQPG